MASPGHDPSGSGKSTGIKIDSSLIKTASNDVQQELSGLGVSVYSQEEFEAGVLHQIDQEVGRRNAEQQKKFVLQEYGTVRQEISTVRTELTHLSKRIALLLSQPLCDVVLRLRELRTSQDVKRKQLQSLEAREQHLLKKLSGREEEDKDFGESSGESTSKDVAFGIPMTGQSSEQQKLIQMGHMTPFGSSIGETLGPQLEERGAPPIDVSSDDVGTDSLVVASSAEHVDDRETTEEGGEQKRTSGIQLCSDGFDGLFSDPPLPSVKRKSPPQTDKGKGKGKGKGRERAKGGAARKNSGLPAQPRAPELEGGLHDATGVVPRSQPSQQERSEDFSLVSTESPSLEDRDADVYHPHLEELEEASDSDVSEYFTDEELGGTGRGSKKLRDLSDGSDDDLILANRRKKRKRKVNERVRRYQDDGDEELYRMRIRQHVEESEPDKQLSGGLRIPGSIWHKLYRYQQTGVQWLWELHCQHAGGIVGDEMGLGKTIEMIAFLAGLKVSNLRSHVTRKLGLGPVLIVCPATVMQQWVSEFHTWWAPFRVVVLHDTGTFLGDKRALVDRIASGSGVLITTYAGIRLYRDLLLGCPWDYIILDEGHKIRNPDAEITLACKQFATPHRLILSGSPMQNNLRELWSLFDFVFPGKLGTLPVFMEQFSVPITLGGYANATQVQVETAYRCACVLRDTINPYLLRRLKADVKLQLPNKNEQVLFCRLTDYQREVYEDYLCSPEVESMLVGRKQVFSGLMTLRKLCNHPDLVTNDYCELRRLCNGEEEDGGEGGSFTTIDVSQEKKRKTRKSAAASLAAAIAAADDEESYGYWRRSGKLEVVESLLKLWKNQGHRVLLFSQSKQMLHIFEAFVASRGYTYQKMDGTTTISSRQPLICKFNEDPSIFIFLLTTRVGGLGVNLTGANRVIIYDPDWNPSTDIQARERAWRIGQTKQVTIYRLLTAGTIEEKIYHRQIFKQFLTNRVLKDPRQRRFFKANDLYELFTLSSSDKDGSTETSAIFAGTGSEVVPKRKPRSPEKSRDWRHSERISLAGSKRKSHDSSTAIPEKKKNKSHDTNLAQSSKQNASLEVEEWNWDPTTADGLQGASEDSNGSQLLSGEGSQQPAGSDPGSPGSDHPQAPQGQPGKSETSESVSDSAQPVAGGMESRQTLGGKKQEPILNGMELGPSSPRFDPGSSSSGIEFNHVSFKKKHRHKKNKKSKTSKGEQKSRRKHRNMVVDGEEIVGLERTGVFNPGGGDEEDLNEKQDDYIIRKLFKKTGIHSALQHDNIMNSADPDYILVESEAKKVAQSASKALRDSRRRCQTARLGQPTWTGQHGSAGVPKPRFGTGIKGQSLASSKQAGSSTHFDGRVPGSGSLSTSSSLLLARMRSRNVHSLPEGASGLHRSTHSNLMQEVRDFIATRCKVDGQATTSEILGQFSSQLSPSENAVFRSMLHEICDFSRHGGEGLWFLKQDFR